MKGFFRHTCCSLPKKNSAMNMKKLNLIPTGISLVDKAWGGFYKGGTYLLLGQKKSGKTLLGLQFAIRIKKFASILPICVQRT